MTDHPAAIAEPMHWISVDDALPKDRQAVLFRYSRDNHHLKGTLANGERFERWHWAAGWISYGKTKEEVAKGGGSFCGDDQMGNNKRPYSWQTFGPGSYWGQEVTHWAAITDVAGDHITQSGGRGD